MAIMEGTEHPKVYIGYYNPAVDGGAEGDHVMRSNHGPLPVGARVLSGALDVNAALVTETNSGDDEASVSIKVNASNDIINGAAVDGAPWSTTGHKDIIPDGTGSTAIELTAARYPTVVVAAEALATGNITLVLYYV